MPAPHSVRYIRKQGSGRTTYKQRERILQRSLTKYLNSLQVDFHNDWAAGAYLTQGQNSAKKSMDSNRGWVDLFIAEPRDGYHGLFLELKKEGEHVWLKNGNLRKNDQLYKENLFLERQRDKGYRAEFAIGLEETKRIINEYLGLPVQESIF